jgi:hypothetical protein
VVGQYATGDYYVVAPLGMTITAITPPSAQLSGTYAGGAAYTNKVFHGAMVNPAQGTNGWAAVPQGWNSIQSGEPPQSATTIQPYSAALNVDPGIAGTLTINAPCMVVKAKQNTTPPNDARTGLTTDMAALAVVAAAPPANAFRPSMRGADMTSYFTTDDMDISFLPNVPVVGTPPSYSTLLGYVSKIYQTAFTNNLFTRGFNPVNHQEGYGRDIASRLEDVLLTLCTNALTTEQKRNLMIHVTQLGLDILGAVQDGARWALPNGSFGGGQHWVKPVAIVAAYALRNAANSTKAAELLDLCNPNILAWAPEDWMYKYVDRQQIESFPDQRSGFDHIPYWDYMENAPMWNSKPSAPTYSGSAWNHVYRTLVAGSSLAAWLALRMMGLAGPSYVTPAAINYLDFLYDWKHIETWTVGAPSAYKQAMLDAYLPTTSAAFSDTAAPSLVRTVARDSYVWFEFDKLLSRRFVPAASAFTVLVNGVPATIVSAPNQFTTQPFSNRSPDVYGKSLAVRLQTPVAEGDTVTIAYVQPNSDQARTLGGTFVPSIAVTTATNLTGTLPDPVTTITRVNGQTNLARASRQISRTSTPPSLQIGWMQMSARFRIKSITLNDTLISNQSGSSTAFWLYWASATQLRLHYGTASTDRVDFNNAASNLPQNTDITAHFWFDYSAATLVDGVKVTFVWDGGSWTPTIPGTARTPSTPNIATIFSGGIHVGGPSTTSNREADMDHIAYLFRWGAGAAPAAPNFSDPQFAWNADWGGNGQNVWGVPTRYYAGTLQEWNGGISNRGNGGSHVLAPAKLVPDTEDLLTEYVAGS